MLTYTVFAGLECLVPGEAYGVPLLEFWRPGAAEKLRAYSHL